MRDAGFNIQVDLSRVRNMNDATVLLEWGE